MEIRLSDVITSETPLDVRAMYWRLMRLDPFFDKAPPPPELAKAHARRVSVIIPDPETLELTDER